MNLLDWINQGIDALTNTASPSIDALGFHIFVALLTVMMVWFGVQEALASAQGATGFNMAKFVHFVVMGSFTYTLIEFYHSAIPGVGYSFHDFITVGATSVANMIGQDSINQMLKAINDLQGQAGSDILKAIMNTYYAIVVVIVSMLTRHYPDCSLRPSIADCSRWVCSCHFQSAKTSNDGKNYGTGAA